MWEKFIKTTSAVYVWGALFFPDTGSVRCSLGETLSVDKAELAVKLD